MRFCFLVFITFSIASMSMLTTGCDKGAKVEDKPFDFSTYEDYGPVHPNPAVTVRTMEDGEPSHISIQHILIGFAGSVEDNSVERSKVEAQKLAEEVFKKAQAGDDFDTLVEFYTDDKIPGIYKVANHTVSGDRPGMDKTKWIFERSELVPVFGDVGFKLEVGEVGMGEYDSKKSPFGWHIMKRIE